jgi:hypothetical protein
MDFGQSSDHADGYITPTPGRLPGESKDLLAKSREIMEQTEHHCAAWWQEEKKVKGVEENEIEDVEEGEVKAYFKR